MRLGTRNLLNQNDPRQDRWPQSNYTKSSDTKDLKVIREI